MAPVTQLGPFTRQWPIHVALAIVVALLAGMIGVDLVIARRVAARTAQIVENTQRSVELLEDLHSETFRLARLISTPAVREAAAARLAAIAAEYDKVATDLGERAEWHALSETIRRLHVSAGSGRVEELRTLSDEIDLRVDRLVAINREAARANAEQIAAAHRDAIVADGSVGALVLLLSAGVAFVLRRLVSRQRALFAAHIALLDERNRELDLFAGRAAHDLRVPLSPIRGYADLLATGAESPAEVQQMASRIRSAVDKMARVVDDMLELSRAGRPLAGRSSLRAATTEVLDELEPELRGVQVEVALPDEIVACAPGVLQQVLRNLVHNAVKFRARDRPLAIRISGPPASAPNAPLVELAVEDNGVGMDEEAAASVFLPYHRGRTDREVPGHGLGLAIVHRTVQALGGTIRLESRPNAGCRIVIALPVAR